MTKKSCSGRAACASHQDESKIRGEASQGTKHRQSSSSGPNAPPKKKTWKKYLTFLSKFQNKMKHKKPDARAPSSFKQSSLKRSSSAMLEECVNLVRVIRRTAADCFVSAVARGDEDDELPCYMQLDQVGYGVKREAYGPIYLVT
ncbi:unnamed protein product [Miscanthus lutarioriparius]|uniref:Uncharacterized protein n=1 Tax=Miscanthus lutarioriparius TaxID=422564 RepID=A0A811MHR6_9POAL|nr:unnamed protein product [Miscanthus lutarioriparius]